MGFLGMGGSSRQKMPLNITNVLIIFALALVVFQAFGLVFGSALGLDVHLGPIFVLIPVLGAAITAFAIAKKLLSDMPLIKQDIFGIMIVTLMAVFALFFMPDLIPGIFEPDLSQLQALIGF